MVELHFSGDLTCPSGTMPVEFNLEIDREQLLALASLLLPAGHPPAGSIPLNDPGFEPEPDRANLDEELRPHAGRAITGADLARVGSGAARWALLGQRFPWLFAEEAGVARPPATLKDIEKLQRADESALPAPADQLGQDLVKIWPLRYKLIQDGQFIRGYQTRIAEALGITNSGASNRRRIMRVAKAVLKKLSSSSSVNRAVKSSKDQLQAA